MNDESWIDDDWLGELATKETHTWLLTDVLHEWPLRLYYNVSGPAKGLWTLFETRGDDEFTLCYVLERSELGRVLDLVEAAERDRQGCGMSGQELGLWEVDGEDLIVAASEREMRWLYREHHEETIRGHSIRQIPSHETIELTHGDGSETWKVTAADYAKTPGYFPAWR